MPGIAWLPVAQTIDVGIRRPRQSRPTENRHYGRPDIFENMCHDTPASAESRDRHIDATHTARLIAVIRPKAKNSPAGRAPSAKTCAPQELDLILLDPCSKAAIAIDSIEKQAKWR